MDKEQMEMIEQIVAYVKGEPTIENLTQAVHDWFIDMRKFSNQYQEDEAFKTSVLKTLELLIKEN